MCVAPPLHVVCASHVSFHGAHVPHPPSLLALCEPGVCTVCLSRALCGVALTLPCTTSDTTTRFSNVTICVLYRQAQLHCRKQLPVAYGVSLSVQTLHCSSHESSILIGNPPSAVQVPPGVLLPFRQFANNLFDMSVLGTQEGTYLSWSM